MRCTISHKPATLIAIPLLAVGLDVRAQEQVPGGTYTADLLRPWTCDSYLERQAQGWPPAGGEPFVVPLAADASPPGGEPVPQFVPEFPATPPFLGLNFAGVQYGPDSGDHPPDTMGAVGPNHFMEVINGNVSIFRKSDGMRIASETLGSFFRHSGWDSVSPFDPRVLFDQHSGRWIVVAANFDTAIALAVSQSDDPTGTFCKTSFVASAGLDVAAYPDYPTLGVDANGIYIGAYMLGSGWTIWAIDKPPLLAVLPSSPSWGTVTAWRRLPGGSTHQPAHTYGTPGSEYIIGAVGNSLETLRIFRVDPPLSAPTMSTWTIPVSPYGFLFDDPPALDSDVGIRVVGTRLMMSVYRDGSLWTTHCIDVNGRAGIRWYQINPTYGVPPDQAVRQWGNVTHPSLPLHFYLPSLMVNRAGQVALAFSGSDANHFVGAYYTGRRAGDQSGLMAVPQLLKAGEGPYMGRWGDYSYTTLDPLDESTFWTIQEYATPGGYNWGTWIAALGPFVICNDNNGNSPLVCVDWDQARPPLPDQDFSLDNVTNRTNPDVTFALANDGWNVWSQVSRTDATPANLGHIGINPLAPGDNFSVTIAHGELPGAANVASIALVKPDSNWTGQSNISGGSIAGNLTGDLVLQESAGQGGEASFTIGGNVYGHITIPKVDSFEVKGSVAAQATITVHDFVGDKGVLFNTNPGPGPRTFAGNMSLPNGLPSDALIWIGGQLASTASLLFGPGAGGMDGVVVIGGNCDGSIEVIGDMAGVILVPAGSINGNVTVSGTFDGEICGFNLQSLGLNQLPANIQIAQFGPNATICGQLVCGNAAQPDPAVSKNRALSFSVPPPGGAAGAQTAIRVKLVDLQNPNPPNLSQFPPPNFSGYESGTCAPKRCVGGTRNGLTCILPADCPGGACNAAVESNGCARWVGPPATFLEDQETPGGASFRAARLQCTPFYHDWSTEGVFHVVGAEIMPSSTYELQAVPVVGSLCAAQITFRTARYGDVEAPFNPPSPYNQPTAIDVAQVVAKVKNLPGALVKSISQLQTNLVELNANVSVLDIVAVVDAVKGIAYAFSGPCPCPSTVTCGSTACSNSTPCVTLFGPWSLCVKTCVNGPNMGEPCIDVTRHCPGGTACGAAGANPGFCRDRCGRCN